MGTTGFLPSQQESSAPSAKALLSAVDHRVQFYDSEDFLALTVANFLEEGIRGGQPLVVIATEPHRRSFASQLKSKGHDVDRVSGSGQLMLLDARDTLERSEERRVGEEGRKGWWTDD